MTKSNRAGHNLKSGTMIWGRVSQICNVRNGKRARSEFNWDDEPYLFFPGRKRNDKLALDDILDVDHEPESLLNEELEEDITGETPLWENEESEED